MLQINILTPKTHFEPLGVKMRQSVYDICTCLCLSGVNKHLHVLSKEATCKVSDYCFTALNWGQPGWAGTTKISDHLHMHDRQHNRHAATPLSHEPSTAVTSLRRRWRHFLRTAERPRGTDSTLYGCKGDINKVDGANAVRLPSQHTSICRQNPTPKFYWQDALHLAQVTGSNHCRHRRQLRNLTIYIHNPLQYFSSVAWMKTVKSTIF